jgi:ketosteroid isomerase-like protein
MSRGVFWFGLLGLASLAACEPVVQEKVIDTAADEAAVRKVADELYGYLQSGNYDAAAQLYRDDALVISPGAPAIDKQTLFASAAQASADLPPNAVTRWVINTQEVVVSGDMAYERGTYSTEVVDKTTGEAIQGTSLNPAIIFVHIFRREPDGSWKAWRYHPAPNVAQ